MGKSIGRMRRRSGGRRKIGKRMERASMVLQVVPEEVGQVAARCLALVVGVQALWLVWVPVAREKPRFMEV